MSRGLPLGPAALAALLAVAAAPHGSAEEVVVLANGRKIHGEVEGRRPGGDVVVKTAGGGTVVIPGNQVLRVEKAEPLGRQPFDPERPSSPPPVADDSSAPAGSPTPAAALPSPPAAPVATGSPPRLASPGEVAVARDELRDAAGEARPEARRLRVEAALRRQTTAALAGCCEVLRPDEPAATLALEALEARRADARVALAGRVVALDPVQPFPPVLALALARVGDDPAGTLERAVLALLDAARGRALPCDALAAPLATLGTPRAMPALATIVTESPGTATPTIEGALASIVSRTPDPDAALAPLLSRIDARSTPWAVLARALPLLGQSRGPARATLAAVLERARLEPEGPGPTESSRRACIALASIGTEEALADLLREIETAPDETRRIAAITASAAVRLPTGPARRRFALALVDRLEAARTPAEQRALAAVLGELVGGGYDRDAAAWRRHLAAER